MKRIFVALFAVLIIAASATDAFCLGAFLSYWNGKDIDNGYGAGVKHKYQIVPIFAAEARASWLSFSDADLNLYPLEVTGRARLAMFYGGVGAGYYIFSGNDLDYENEFGTFLFGGLEITLAGLGVFGELKYTWVESKINDVATASANGLGVNVGALLRW